MHSPIKKHLFILTSSWLIVNILVYLSLGVKYAIDTTRFHSEASAWIAGRFEFSYHFWYSGYIAILALCNVFFHSIYPSIIIQCGLSLISILLFYKGLCRLLKAESTAFIAALFVILYIPIQQWNVCLLTESFYISSILLFVWAYSIENNHTKWIILLSIAFLATTLRPNGGILLITAFVLLAKQFITIENRKYIYGTGLFVAIGLFFLLNNTTRIFYQFLMDSFNKGEVICGYSGWIIAIETKIEVTDSKGSIIKILELLISHPWQCIQLGIYRFIALWADVRMYYSTTHNTYIVLMLLPTYVFSCIGMFHYKKIHSGLFLITLLYAGLNSLLVVITYADWDGRFLAPLLPVLFIWSALGIHDLHRRQNSCQQKLNKAFCIFCLSMFCAIQTIYP